VKGRIYLTRRVALLETEMAVEPSLSAKRAAHNTEGVGARISATNRIRQSGDVASEENSATSEEERKISALSMSDECYHEHQNGRTMLNKAAAPTMVCWSVAIP
jgi:hypothetical protein